MFTIGLNESWAVIRKDRVMNFFSDEEAATEYARASNAICGTDEYTAVEICVNISTKIMEQ